MAGRVRASCQARTKPILPRKGSMQMELIETVLNAVLILLVGGLLSWQMSGRFGAMARRMDGLEHRMDGLRLSVDGLRSDLTQVALAVGATPGTGSART